MKTLGIFLIVLAAFLLTVLAVAAAKGFLTARGLIVDLPAQGRVYPLPAVAAFAIVLSIAILGIVMFIVGKRPPEKNFQPQNEHHRPSQ